MSEGQWKRWDAVARLGAGKLTLAEAARVLRLSVDAARTRALALLAARPRHRRGKPLRELEDRLHAALAATERSHQR